MNQILTSISFSLVIHKYFVSKEPFKLGVMQHETRNQKQEEDEMQAALKRQQKQQVNKIREMASASDLKHSKSDFLEYRYHPNFYFCDTVIKFSQRSSGTCF